MKNIYALLMAINCLCFGSISAEQLDVKQGHTYITYDYLASSNWTNHVIAFRELFQITKIHSFLEFGLGRATKYFIENCDRVTSFEISVPSQAKAVEPWYNSTKKLLKDYKNWNPVLYRASLLLDYYHRMGNVQPYPASKIREYLKDLNHVCEKALKTGKYDLAFVDPGISMRGDMVNALFNKVDIIAAHDTHEAHEIYGWTHITTPTNYEKIHFPIGLGVTFWIKKHTLKSSKR